LGTYSGGWRIIHTLGSKVMKLDPIHGFAAQTSAATIIEVATRFGFPVSTTHTITSAIMGVGSTQRLSAVRWGVARDIVTAWLLTLPAAAVVGAATYLVLNIFF
jgi:PiT family inorganic phosphate transporter